MEKIFNTTGAANYLQCGIDNIHKRVAAGRLKAHKYDIAGELVAHSPVDQHRGQGLYFLQSDLDAYQRTKKRGRPFSDKQRTGQKNA